MPGEGALQRLAEVPPIPDAGERLANALRTLAPPVPTKVPVEVRRSPLPKAATLYNGELTAAALAAATAAVASVADAQTQAARALLTHHVGASEQSLGEGALHCLAMVPAPAE